MALLAGCGGNSGTTESETPNYVDKDFIKDLGKGLETRWDASDKLDQEKATLSDVEYGQKVAEIIDAEINTISKYKTGLFEDTKLQETALSYLNCLEQSKEPLGDLGTDYYSAAEKFDKAQEARYVILQEFATNYGLTVGKKYQTTMNEMLTKAKSVTKKEEEKKTVESVLLNLNFEEIENSYGLKTYRAVLDNTSGFDIDYVSYSIDLLDANGVVLEQEFAGADNVTNGKKYNIEFMTDIDFNKYELSVDYSIDN